MSEAAGGIPTMKAAGGIGTMKAAVGIGTMKAAGGIPTVEAAGGILPHGDRRKPLAQAKKRLPSPNKTSLAFPKDQHKLQSDSSKMRVHSSKYPFPQKNIPLFSKA